MEAFRQATSDVGSVFPVLDALDECTDRSTLLKGIRDIPSWALPSIHILATSRKETDIEDYLIKLVTCQVCLEESVVDSDIRSFVQNQIEQDPQLLKWSPEIRDEIETTLLEGANGM